MARCQCQWPLRWSVTVPLAVSRCTLLFGSAGKAADSDAGSWHWQLGPPPLAGRPAHDLPVPLRAEAGPGRCSRPGPRAAAVHWHVAPAVAAAQVAGDSELRRRLTAMLAPAIRGWASSPVRGSRPRRRKA
jgi:hypothetical protein